MIVLKKVFFMDDIWGFFVVFKCIYVNIYIFKLGENEEVMNILDVNINIYFTEFKGSSWMRIDY